eukprot:3458500-Lingulodinium_polyedra.AAC.1
MNAEQRNSGHCRRADAGAAGQRAQGSTGDAEGTGASPRLGAPAPEDPGPASNEPGTQRVTAYRTGG